MNNAFLQYNPAPIEPAWVAQQRAAQMQGAQRNALMQQMQYEDAMQQRQAQQQQAQQNALMQQVRQRELGAMNSGAGPAMPFDPQRLISSGAFAPAEVKTMGEVINPERKLHNVGNVALDARTAKPVFTATPETKLPEGMRIGANGPEWIPTYLEGRGKVAAQGASKNIFDMKQPTKFAEGQGKEFSDLMSRINAQGFAAPAQMRKLERMQQLLEGVDGGKLAPTGLEVASAMGSIGLKVDPRLGNKEAAQALSREIAGGFRQPGTGTMTDKDFENFLLQVPDLSKSAEGRKQITATMKAALNRDVEIAKRARAYVAKHGQLDNDFLDEAAQFIAENPVVGAPTGWQVQR